MELSEIYKTAANAANKDGVKVSDQAALVAWIRANCRYRTDAEFFLVFGIGCELADIQAREQGYKSEVDRAYTIAANNLKRRQSATR